MQQLANTKIAIVGQGKVSLPLAVELGKRYNTIGVDIYTARIDELHFGHYHTLEVNGAELASVPRLGFSSDLAELQSCNVYIVTGHAPIFIARRPDSPDPSSSNVPCRLYNIGNE